MSAKTIYSYLRFSSPQQEWGDSERRQENLAKEYCVKNGLVLSEKNFADRGISAWKGANRRGALGELLNILKPGDYLLIEDNDRLSREDPLTAMNLLHSIVFKGVTVITLRDGNTITRDNFFNLSIFLPSIVKSALANEENVKKSARIKESWVSRRKQMAEGKFVGGKLPFWIKKNQNNAPIVIEERVAVIRNIFNMAYSGLGYRSIMRKLAADKVPTYRKNKKWSKGGISYLLKNRAVYGSLQPFVLENKERIPIGDPIDNYYPIIVKKEKFLAVQNKISKRLMFGGGPITDKVSNLLSGICKCMECGENVIITHKGRNSISYLACSSYHWHHRCSKAVVNYLQVEKSLLGFIEKNKDTIQALYPNKSASQLQIRIDETKALIDDLEIKIKKLTDVIEKPDAPDPLIARLRQRVSERDKLKQELANLIGQQFIANNMVPLKQVEINIQREINRIVPGVTIRLGDGADDKRADLIASRNRLMIREALRNSISEMKLKLTAKRLSIKWNSGIATEIEMMCKRQGQKKAIYLFRSMISGKAWSEWVSMGSIL